MKRIKVKFNKRIWSILICFVLLCAYLPIAVNAAKDDSLCEHHPEHTEECGYAEGEAECGYACALCAAEDADAPAEDAEPIEAPAEDAPEEPAEEPAEDAPAEEPTATPQPEEADDEPAEEQEPAEDAQEPADEETPAEPALTEAATAVWEELCAQPSVETLKRMELMEQKHVYEAVQDLYDRYEALSAEERAAIPEAEERFKALFAYFNTLVEPTAYSQSIEELFIDGYWVINNHNVYEDYFAEIYDGLFTFDEENDALLFTKSAYTVTGQSGSEQTDAFIYAVGSLKLGMADSVSKVKIDLSGVDYLAVHVLSADGSGNSNLEICMESDLEFVMNADKFGNSGGSSQFIVDGSLTLDYFSELAVHTYQMPENEPIININHFNENNIVNIKYGAKLTVDNAGSSVTASTDPVYVLKDTKIHLEDGGALVAEGGGAFSLVDCPLSGTGAIIADRMVGIMSAYAEPDEWKQGAYDSTLNLLLVQNDKGEAKIYADGSNISLSASLRIDNAVPNIDKECCIYSPSLILAKGLKVSKGYFVLFGDNASVKSYEEVENNGTIEMSSNVQMEMQSGFTNNGNFWIRNGTNVRLTSGLLANIGEIQVGKDSKLTVNTPTKGGTLNNVGSIEIIDNGNLVCNGSYLGNDKGTLSLEDTATMSIGKTATVPGTITVGGSAELVSKSSLKCTGTITVKEKGTYTTKGTLTNDGTISLQGNARMNNSGTFTNNKTMTLQDKAQYANVDGGTSSCGAESSHCYDETASMAKRVCVLCGVTNCNHDVGYTNGFCSGCGDAYQPCSGSGTSEDPYKIANGGNLYWFAEVVNNGYGSVASNTSAVAKLTANIRVNSGVLDANGDINTENADSFRTWTPIGTSSKRFFGRIDGNGKKISGLYCPMTGDYSGLTGRAGWGTGALPTFSNLGIDDSYFSGHTHVGSFCGELSLIQGTIEGCWSAATVVCIPDGESSIFGWGDGDQIGGLFGSLSGTSAAGKVGELKNCYFTGKVDAVDAASVGGISGDSQDVLYTNCYNTGTVIGDYLVAGIAASQKYVNSFSYCYNAGTVTAKELYAAGITNRMGTYTGKSSVTSIAYMDHCYNSGAISVTERGDAAGLCNGLSEGTISDCYNTGAISCENGAGGVVGEAQNTQAEDPIRYKMTIRNCYNYGTVTASQYVQNCGAIVGLRTNNTNPVVIADCFYLQGCATGKGVTQNGVGRPSSASSTELADVAGETAAMSAAAFKSGEVTYKLNNGVTDGTQSWYQTCGTGLPLYRGKTVWYGYKNCLAREKGYYNTLVYEEIPTHEFENGFCIYCDVYEPCKGSGTATDPYKIANGGNLYWFAAVTTSGYSVENSGYDAVAKNCAACAELTADIVVNDFTVDDSGHAYGGTKTTREWIPIVNGCSKGYEYSGTFDGKNHTISGIYFHHEDKNRGYLALFHKVSGGTIRNLGLINSTFTHSTIVSYDEATLVGFLSSGSTLEHCYSTAYLQTGRNSGGLVGENYGTIRNCFYAGGFEGDYANYRSPGGGIAGTNGGTIENCHYAGDTKGSNGREEKCVNGIVGTDDGGTVTNCYYIANENINEAGGGTEKSAAVFASGELTWTLNNGVSNGTQIWYQTLGTDAYPNFTGKTVYMRGWCDEDPTEYSNISYPKHKQYENGFCTVCDAYEHCEIDADGTYLIDNAGKLYCFAAIITGDYEGMTKNSSANGRVTADIFVNQNVLTASGALNETPARTWKAIGTKSTPYRGTFDGGSKTISGLYAANGTDSCGLFGSVKNATVKNVNLVDSFFAANSEFGSIVGCAEDGGAILNCTSAVSVEATEASEQVGGIVGSISAGKGEFQLRNCSFTGKIQGEHLSRIGGIVGSATGNVTIDHCRNESAVLTFVNETYAMLIGPNGNIGGIAGSSSGATIRNCYNLGEVRCDLAVDMYMNFPENAGGIVGKASDNAVIEDCYNMGAVTIDINIGGILGNNGGATVTNCYYLQGGEVKYGIGTTSADQDGVAVKKTADAFKSGEAAYLLNSGVTDGTQAWYQTVRTDNYPKFSGDTVYHGYFSCADEEKSYTNDQNAVEERVHAYTGEPDFEWSDDWSSCNAVFSCAVDATHETLTLTCDVDKKLSTDEKEWIYTASVTHNGTLYTDKQTAPNVVIDVNVTWGAMSFTYQDGTWNPSEHVYEGGGWTADGNTVTVKNNGNKAVTASLSYTNADGFSFAGTFENGAERTVGAGTQELFTLTIGNKPEAALNGTKIGAITLKLAPENNEENG